jgi:hypothetical protein
MGLLSLARSRDLTPVVRVRRLLVRVALVDVAAALAIVPEVATYPNWNGLMHLPMFGRVAALLLAVVTPIVVLVIAAPLAWRHREARAGGALTVALSLLPLPLHLLACRGAEACLGVHFFVR